MTPEQIVADLPDLENFTRVETFGDNANSNTLTNDVHWVKVLVDPTSREVFSYQAQTFPATGLPSRELSRVGGLAGRRALDRSRSRGVSC